MDNIEAKLETLLLFYAGARGVGHTHNMVHGAANSAAVPFVLVGAMPQARWLRETGLIRAEYITPETVGRIVGSKAPLSVDHYALQRLFEAALGRMREASRELARVSELARRANAEVADLQARLERAWLPASEPPPHNIHVLMVCLNPAGQGEVTVGFYDGEEGQWFDALWRDGDRRVIEVGEVTHWQPLPNPPAFIVSQS